MGHGADATRPAFAPMTDWLVSGIRTVVARPRRNRDFACLARLAGVRIRSMTKGVRPPRFANACLCNRMAAR